MKKSTLMIAVSVLAGITALLYLFEIVSSLARSGTIMLFPLVFLIIWTAVAMFFYRRARTMRRISDD